jgi:hypothetical protein
MYAGHARPGPRSAAARANPGEGDGAVNSAVIDPGTSTAADMAAIGLGYCRPEHETDLNGRLKSVMEPLPGCEGASR